MDEALASDPAAATAGASGTIVGAQADGVVLTEMTGQVEQPHSEPVLLGLEAETWVYISVSIFFILAVVIGKLPQRIASALDDRIAGVRKQLDEAKALRAEAETLLAGAKARADEAASDAAAMIARAETEAADLVKASEKTAAETIARRMAAAEAKIAAAERSAETELKAQLARQVTNAAAALIADKADKSMHDRLTEDAISGLERRLH